MKWKNKGLEFEDKRKSYRRLLSGKDIYIFGAGKLGREYAGALKFFALLCGFVDNDEKKQEKGFLGFPVISVKACIGRKAFIVVCVGDKFMDPVVEQLDREGLSLDKDYMLCYDFFNKVMPYLCMLEQRKIYLPMVQLSLTERCTLKCKKCAHACNLVQPSREDLTLNEAKRSVDCFFAFVDYVHEFALIGGEPLLYKNLTEIIEYIGMNYRARIARISITTNGTILPSDDVCNMCKKYRLMIGISNYSKAIPRLKSEYDLLIKKLDSWELRYHLADPDIFWMDYGFEYYDRKASPMELEKVFDECSTPCHEIRESRFYHCIMARSVAENMNRGIGEDDYMDLAKMDRTKDKRLVFEYMMGFSEKGYLDMCNFCHGAAAKQYSILPAEQME